MIQRLGWFFLAANIAVFPKRIVLPEFCCWLVGWCVTSCTAEDRPTGRPDFVQRWRQRSSGPRLHGGGACGRACPVLVWPRRWVTCSAGRWSETGQRRTLAYSLRLATNCRPTYTHGQPSTLHSLLLFQFLTVYILSMVFFYSVVYDE